MTTPLYWIELNDADELWVGTTLAGLLAILIPGYVQMGTARSLTARRAYATTVARATQERLFAQAIAEGTADITTIPDRVVDRLLGDREFDVHEPWEFDAIPLIVLGGERSDWWPPVGNVTVIDARSDGLLLLSLARLGEIRSLGLLSGPTLLPHPLRL